MHNLMMHTFIFLSLFTLLTPVLASMLPLMKNKTWKNNTLAMKLAFYISIMPMLISINMGLQSMTTNAIWFNSHLDIKISLLFDQYSMMFLPTALFISWAILEFTNWYMSADINLEQFTKYLMIFLLSMITLTTANSLLLLFVGWEGVGIMSFLLISWWSSRLNANTAALQAVIYNRLGDIGLFMTMAWFSMNLNTLEMQQMFSYKMIPLLPLLGLILAATGKSAQFGLHPWLPAAMEGPTPVSALLHSSTMVIAGIFMLIRMNPMLSMNQNTNTMCLCLGAMTTIFTAFCALTQNDIKKIIAFSTTSQLGLMMVAIGLNQPELAFFHILTHAFFKAMLFLCSGSIIHSLMDEQDIRKMGGLQKMLPITTSCMTMGNLALTGTPFLAGFYSKDLIIECLNTSYTNAWALTTTLIATSMTAAYSSRMIFYVQMNPPQHNPILTTLEVNQNQTNPLIRLAAGSMMMGLLIITVVLPNKTQVMTMPTSTKSMALLVSLAGLLTALETTKTTSLFMKPKYLYVMTTQLGFFNTTTHRKLTNKMLNTGQKIALQLNDQLWYEKLAPNMIMSMNTKTSKKMSNLHKGIIKTYLTVFSMLLLTIML
ncbi:NADH dehydrogenase subunit 5 (mitochondrion) [Eublepharis macularius]|uniref:NADH-ubiquinone oxidoreductase chain 5 n=1 Tax=Eublepharis macularius TaxID=481883 RepID=A0A1L7NTZ2_EUBMA|nr:NADH dehydrogenase subunit 5 [Eublepharis macularius]BAW33383.1 NADH dehydrogenase subunit 5 [Eublepharis macularius]